MLNGPLRLSLLVAVLTFGATGIAMALAGTGFPFLLASLLGAAAVGLVLYAALRQQPGPTVDRSAEQAAIDDLQQFRTDSSDLRHDLRGILSPALMMTDRLLKHEDPAVRRAGSAILKSIEKATALLTVIREPLKSGPPSI